MQPALLGGLFIGVLSSLPIVNICNCCCLWILGGGALAAYLQQQNQPMPITVAQGARVGLLAGVVAAFVWLVTSPALELLISPFQQRLASEILRTARDIPPELRDWFERAGEGGTLGGYMFGFLLMLFGGSAVAAGGGAIGAAYFRNDVPPALGGPINPPPLP
jgi:hypothetical protein